MLKLRRYLFWFILGICSVVLIVACDRSPNSLKSNSSTPASSESCRLVSHEMGETEVCGQPQKVVALSPHILDIILALEVQPAGFAQSEDSQIQTYDNPTEQIPYLGQWVKTQPVGVGDRKSPSLERLTLLQPDLILGEHFNNKDEYSLLTQIAPTLLFSDRQNPNEPQSWQQDIKGIAQALGKEAQAEELLTTLNKQIAQARTALQPVLQENSRVVLISSNLTNFVYSQPESTTGRLLQEIGFEIVQPKGTQGNTEISWEILPKVETDLIIVLDTNRDHFMKPEAPRQEKWAQNPLLDSMPVFQQGRVFFVDYYLWGGHTRGPLSDKLILEALPDLLLDALQTQKVKQ